MKASSTALVVWVALSVVGSALGAPKRPKEPRTDATRDKEPRTDATPSTAGADQDPPASMQYVSKYGMKTDATMIRELDGVSRTAHRLQGLTRDNIYGGMFAEEPAYIDAYIRRNVSQRNLSLYAFACGYPYSTGWQDADGGTGSTSELPGYLRTGTYGYPRRYQGYTLHYDTSVAYVTSPPYRDYVVRLAQSIVTRPNYRAQARLIATLTPDDITGSLIEQTRKNPRKHDYDATLSGDEQEAESTAGRQCKKRKKGKECRFRFPQPETDRSFDPDGEDPRYDPGSGGIGVA